MTALYIFIASVIILIILVLLSSISIFFEYKKYPGEKLYTKIKLSVGVIKLDKSVQKKLLQIKNNKNKDDSSITEKIQLAGTVLDSAKKFYSKNQLLIQKSLIIENVDFHLKFGLSDAAQTGIATGGIWAVLYSALAIADTLGTVKKHNFEVVPVYTEAGFISQGEFKGSVRVINALSIALRMCLIYKETLKKESK